MKPDEGSGDGVRGAAGREPGPLRSGSERRGKPRSGLAFGKSLCFLNP